MTIDSVATIAGAARDSALAREAVRETVAAVAPILLVTLGMFFGLLSLRARR